MVDKVNPIVPVAPVIVEPVVVPEVKASEVDAKTLLLLIYMLYKLNLISRISVREILAVIKDGKYPDDITKFLMEEVKKL